MFYLSTCFIVVLDQLTKHYALAYLSPGDTLPLIPNFFHLTLVKNKGIAFGFFQRHPEFLFVLISLSILALIFFAYRMTTAQTKPPRLALWGLALILGGAIGNWIDRIRFQAVIDFLDFRIWPVFNVADSCITLGVGLYLILLMRKS